MNEATDKAANQTAPTPDGRPPATAPKPISMHEGVPHWHDVCCCEAEPRWVALAEELGIDLDAGWDRT